MSKNTRANKIFWRFRMRLMSIRLMGTRRGTSLLIALGLVTVIALVSIGITTVVVSSIRDSANVSRANEAYYAAEGALEQGLMLNQQAGAGFNTDGYKDADFKNPPNCQDDPSCKIVQGKYTVVGQVPQKTKFSGGPYNNLYGIPTPGTGNAGNNCDALNPLISGSYYYPPGVPLQNNIPAEDHPCNWNKIKVGDTVAIPLYVETSANADNVKCLADPDKNDFRLCNPADLGLKNLIIRVRTPCGSIGNVDDVCQPQERYSLDTTTGDKSVNFNDVVLDWQIMGTNTDGSKNYNLGPFRHYNLQDCPSGYCNDDSEIYESLLNTKKASSDYNVLHLDVNSSEIGEDLSSNPSTVDSIYAFLLNIAPWNLGGTIRPNNPSDAISKPVLKLSVIHSLQHDNNTKIPFLEYQILTNVTLQPTDSSQTITAEGFSGTFKQVLQVKSPQQSTFLQYVIQQ